MSRKIALALISIAALSLQLSGAWAGESFSEDGNGVALNRFDPVSYFTQPEPLLGNRTHAYVYQGSKFYFVSRENLRKFVANPELYAPQFGGYCAYAAADGRRTATNPRVFQIQSGKLYLFNDRQARASWRQGVADNVARAMEKWANSASIAKN